MILHRSYLVMILIGLSQLGFSQTTFNLQEAIDYALEHHKSIRASELDADDAKWQYKEAFAIGLPNISGKVNYSYYFAQPVNPVQDFISPAVYGVLFQEGVLAPRELGDPETFEIGFTQANQLSFGLNMDMLLFDGNYLKGLRAARKFMDLAAKQVLLTEQDIVNNVTRAYQNVLIAERNVGIIQDNIDNVTNLLRETQIIYENGFVEELDVDRLRVSLENLTIEYQKIEQLIEVNYTLLKYQMAHPMQDGITISDKLEATVDQTLAAPIIDLSNIDYAKRPEHQLLLDAIDLDYADLDRIKMGYWPTIMANVGYSQSLQRNDLFDGNESGFLPKGSVGLKTRIPIYDGGFTKAKIQQKQIEIEKRQIQLSEFDRSMALQIRTGLIAFDIAKRNLVSVKRSLELNQKIYDKTKIKYNEGVGSSIEVTLAESALYRAQAQYINALYDLLTSRTDVEIATGQLLERMK